MPIDYSKYHPKWKLIVRLVLRRDNYTCQLCGLLRGQQDPYSKTSPVTGQKRKVIITVAHVSRNRNMNRFWNLVSFCLRCHIRYDQLQHVYSRKYGSETIYVNGKLFNYDTETHNHFHSPGKNGRLESPRLYTPRVPVAGYLEHRYKSGRDQRQRLREANGPHRAGEPGTDLQLFAVIKEDQDG